MLTVVIPTLNEANTLPRLLCDLAQLDVPCEIIVADGGSRDDTCELAARGGARVVTTGQGRARQMNRGASCSVGDWLLFLHADARLPAQARGDLRDALCGPLTIEAAVWRLRIGSRRWVFRFIELAARARDRWLGLPYGDQGLFVRRRVFEAVGGFPDVPVMEDVAMVRAIRTQCKICRFRSSVVVSSRRWDRYGPIRSSFRNIALIIAFYVGVPPQRLTAFYRPESR